MLRSLSPFCDVIIYIIQNEFTKHFPKLYQIFFYVFFFNNIKITFLVLVDNLFIFDTPIDG